MKITISASFEGLTRTISVDVTADAGKKLSRVETIYDHFSLAADNLNPPQGSYSRSFKKNEGITPNQPHTVRVDASHTDGTTDSGSKTWVD